MCWLMARFSITHHIIYGFPPVVGAVASYTIYIYIYVLILLFTQEYLPIDIIILLLKVCRHHLVRRDD